jgi:hypothetical protein
MKIKIFVLTLLLSQIVYSQYVNIIPQLKEIEAGNIEEVKSDLAELKQNEAADPNVIFLEAVITEDGEKSRDLYEIVYNDFPKSPFADAALFRSFSFYYALGLYKKAEELKERLKKEYPKSAYLKNTDRNFPNVDEMIIVDPSPINFKDPNKKQFTIQAGAFSDYKNAQNLKSKFTTDGFSSKITPKKVNDLQLHIVTVGTFNKRSDAENFIDDLKRKYSISGRVVELN